MVTAADLGFAHDEKVIFDFELDFAGTLRCIPMIVRFKLDLACIKLSLRQWSRIPREEREILVRLPCQTPAQVTAYHDYLIELIALRAGEEAVELPPIADPDWADVRRIPPRLTDFALAQGLVPPSLAAWASMTALQRFTLFKLSRPGHDNDNLVPAMQEFGLLS
jgi:hypothetical protein